MNGPGAGVDDADSDDDESRESVVKHLAERSDTVSEVQVAAADGGDGEGAATQQASVEALDERGDAVGESTNDEGDDVSVDDDFSADEMDDDEISLASPVL